MRRAVVDTLATIVFFTTVAALAELFIAGMAPGDVLLTRAMMIPLMVATGRPYGVWRDWFFRKTRPTVFWSRTVVDVIAFVLFQLPIYALTLIAVGVEPAGIIALLASTAVLMAALSRPFGMFLDAVRSWSGVEGG